MKRLICAKDIEVAEKEGNKVFYIDSNTIVTPAAKDAAINYGMEFSTETPVCEVKDSGEEKTSETVETYKNEVDKNMIYKVLKAMMDKGLLSGIFESLSNQPYTAEKDSGGLKVVRGDSVKFDIFDTGNPNAKVTYQEIISKDEASMSAGFLIIDHSNFDWELTYEEIDYVIEGTLTITINGKTYIAYPGDVVYVPSGSKVVWGSPDKVKLFYVTYPANWADLMN